MYVHKSWQTAVLHHLQDHFQCPDWIQHSEISCPLGKSKDLYNRAPSRPFHGGLMQADINNASAGKTLASQQQALPRRRLTRLLLGAPLDVPGWSLKVQANLHTACRVKRLSHTWRHQWTFEIAPGSAAASYWVSASHCACFCSPNARSC